LRDNGGATKTRELLPQSPGIDAGTSPFSAIGTATTTPAGSFVA
jgi:hypothetical protein